MDDLLGLLISISLIKLSGWKSTCLSMAGRATLAKLVMVATPTYTMQSAIIPKAICLEMEKLQRSFVWGHNGDIRRCHYISWNKLCQPKGNWGLGYLELMNKACMMKIGWEIKVKTSELWVQVLSHIYSI
ncbi:hypothetical protein L6164_000108 [Bauhinia variegata]|uniref:Uncharacterized protein n=1 Tax=Bauhinia variegata TaxID=167791 RepID=A0ACB9Q868_BAUVA|nr:hypothetical protein L6164_000108 [Bauhinia variegata]